MKNQQIYITQADFNRLRRIIANMALAHDVDRRSLDELEHSYGSRDALGLIKEVRKLKNSKNDAEWQRFEELASELDRAVIVETEKIPADVVTMNSRVCLKDIDSGKEHEYQIVYPEDADFEKNRISVLAPIGTAILGYKVGDVIEWAVPAGVRRFKIRKILFQPEAAKEYHLK